LAVSVHWCSAEYPLWPALAASPVAGLAELLLARWDDNWVVPAAAAAAMLAAGAVGSFFS
jgi:dolichol kinase